MLSPVQPRSGTCSSDRPCRNGGGEYRTGFHRHERATRPVRRPMRSTEFQQARLKGSVGEKRKTVKCETAATGNACERTRYHTLPGPVRRAGPTMSRILRCRVSCAPFFLQTLSANCFAPGAQNASAGVLRTPPGICAPGLCAECESHNGHENGSDRYVRSARTVWSGAAVFALADACAGYAAHAGPWDYTLRGAR
jgi:hypothetical protein